MANPNTNGVLDKFRIRNVVKSGFNPGRNQSWDWNELLSTIETQFESKFDLAALQAQVNTNKANIESNGTKITTNNNTGVANASAIANNLSVLNAVSAKLDNLCTVTGNAFKAPNLAAANSLFSKANPCA